MTGITINMDVRDVKAKLGKALTSLPRAQRSFLRRLGLIVQNEAKRNAPVDRGELRSKIRLEERFGSGILSVGPMTSIAVISDAKHSAYVEFGTRPHTAPFSPIQRWAERHGIEGGKIWMKIRREGTESHPFMEPARKEGTRRASQIADEEIRRWGGRI